MDEQEEVQQNNMISNLPLLFANGYPTSLDKITEPQLQNFIPFMVQCSLGHINLQGKIDCSEPEWWPEDLPFTTPFTKPKKFAGNWMEKMKEIVIICYQFHKSVFLLRFCNDLAAYEHASLRFINNYNSTTSLFERRSNKLLVTFRNENMSYDQPQRSRKCLLQAKSKNGRQSGQDLQQMMVEPAPFDIYLCDNCDAELYSKEAILEHEKTCMVDDDDDVILCDTPEPADVDDQQTEQQPTNEIDELRKNFLLNFSLQCRGEDIRKIRNIEKSDSSGTTSTEVKKEESSGFMIIDRNKRMPRRNRAVHSLTRCPTIPLSSPAGQLLLRTTKTVLTKEYLSERLDRMERFCLAPLLSRSSSKPKYFDKKFQLNSPHCTFKKPQDYSSHVYVFPRRQFSQRRRAENFLFLNSSLIRRCRPISVRLKKITDNEMKGKRTLQSHKLNIKLTRDTSRSSNWKISSSTSTTEEIIVDTIDLCSSESEDDSSPAYTTTSSTATTNIQSTTTLSLQTANVAGKISGELFASRTTLTTTTVGSQAGVAVTALSTARNNLNIARKQLEQLSTSINTSEISLIPIRKSFSNCGAIKYGKINVASPLINIVPTTTNDTSSSAVIAAADNKSMSSPLCEGNILLSSATAITAGDSGITLAKPLRPVYIFSNYSANPLAAIVASEIPTDTTTAITTNYRNHNQENHVQNNTGGNVPNSGSILIAKRNSNVGGGGIGSLTTASAAPVTSEWYTGATASSNSSPNQSIERDRDRDRASRSLALMQSFGSPSRVISIDLTS